MKHRSFLLLAVALLVAFPSAVTAQTPSTVTTSCSSAGFIIKALTATTQGCSKIYQNSSGWIGINTTTPKMTLDVANGNLIARGIGNFASSGNSGSVYAGDTAHGMTAYRGGGLVTHGGLALSAYQATNGLFLQDTTGNVGIGTTNPRTSLDVNGIVTTQGFYLHDQWDSNCTFVYAGSGSLNYYSTSCP